MKNIKQLPLPILKADINKIKFLHVNGQYLFKERVLGNSNWKSFDIIKEYSSSPLLQKLPFITNWIKILKEHTNIKVIKNSYISILLEKSSIDWHVDSDNKDYNKSIITAISTTNSFIEFEDAKYSYKDGYSYLIRSGNSHRVLNLNDDIRITLCTTPEGDYHVNVAA